MPGTINDINDTQELDDRVAALLKGMHAASERIMRQLAEEEPDVAGPDAHSNGSANGAPSLLEDLNADLSAPGNGAPAHAGDVQTPEPVHHDHAAAEPVAAAPTLDDINADLEALAVEQPAPEPIDPMAHEPESTVPPGATDAVAIEPVEPPAPAEPADDTVIEPEALVPPHDTGPLPFDQETVEPAEPEAVEPRPVEPDAVEPQAVEPAPQVDSLKFVPPEDEGQSPTTVEEDPAAALAEIGEVEGDGAASAAPARTPEPALPVVAVTAKDINSLDMALAHAAEDLMAGEPVTLHEEPAPEVPPQPIPMPGRTSKAEAKPAPAEPPELLAPETADDTPAEAPAAPPMPRPAAPARPAPAETPRAPSLISRLLGRALRAMASPLQDQPVGVRKAVGYIALNTLFWAGVIWCYLIFFREPVPPQPAPPAAAKAPASRDAGHAPKKDEPRKDAPKKSGGH